MKLRTLLLGLMAIAGVGMMEARTVKYTISLVQPEYVSEKGEAGWVDNTVVTLPGNKEFFIDQWDPVTGEIRVDCGYGCWASNFSISNKTPFRGAITKVELVYTGELDPEFVTFETKTGNFPVFYGDYEAKIEPGKLVWDLDWHGKKDKFHIQIESTRDLKMSRVFVSEINVYYNNRVRCNTDGPAVEEDEAEDDGEKKGPQPEDPEEPIDPPVSGDPKPIREPEVNEKDKKEFWNWIGQLDPTQPGTPETPETPDTRIGDNWDLTGPVPPGTVDVKIKKHLLEPLTEEEFAMIEAKRLPFGKECLDATRNWVSHIPEIKANEPEECQAELRRLNYNDYLQYMHASFETAAVDFVNIVTMADDEYYKKEEEFLRKAKDSLLILGAEWVRLYDIKDPNMDRTIRTYCEKNLPFMNTVNKYQNLFRYILF